MPRGAPQPEAPQTPPDLPDRPERGKQMEALRAAGEYLYARWGWQTNLARRLGVDPRTVRNWISDQDPIPPVAWELIKLLVRWKATHGEVP